MERRAFANGLEGRRRVETVLRNECRVPSVAAAAAAGEARARAAKFGFVLLVFR